MSGQCIASFASLWFSKLHTQKQSNPPPPPFPCCCCCSRPHTHRKPTKRQLPAFASTTQRHTPRESRKHSMVGSTGTIKTMRLLRNKQQSPAAAAAAQQQLPQQQEQQQQRLKLSTTTTLVHATMEETRAPAPMNGNNKNKRHNNSITSNTSSSSASSAGSSTTSSSSMSTSLHPQQHRQPPQQQHTHRYHHQRSASMRDHVLDLPAVEDDIGGIHSEPMPAIAYRQSPASVWVFPPLPPQPNLFCNNSQVSNRANRNCIELMAFFVLLFVL